MTASIASHIPRSETTTTATTLPACRVGWDRGHVLDAANLHARARQRTESRLGAGARGLGTVTCREVVSLHHLINAKELEPFVHTTGGTDLDVQGSDA
jgi:hypothetical protein